MRKSVNAFRTISEVAEWLGTPTHVLRFWESKFSQIKPVKRAGGRRYYRPKDMLLIGGIKQLLHEDGFTIKGVQKILREQGAKHVCGLSPALCLEEPFSEPIVAKRTIGSADWQPMQISDFATDIGEETTNDFFEISDNKNINTSLAPHTYSASPKKKINENTKNHGSQFGNPIATKELELPPNPDVSSQEAVNEIVSNTPLTKDPLEEFNTEQLLNKVSKPIEIGKDDYDKSKPFFEYGQSELNLGLDEKNSGLIELNGPRENISASPSFVEPTFSSIMAYLRGGHNIENEAATLLKSIFANLENRLIQRRSGNFK